MQATRRSTDPDRRPDPPRRDPDRGPSLRIITALAMLRHGKDPATIATTTPCPPGPARVELSCGPSSPVGVPE